MTKKLFIKIITVVLWCSCSSLYSISINKLTAPSYEVETSIKVLDMNTRRNGAIFIMGQLQLDFDVEEWKDVPGFEGYYQMSNKARVKSLPRWVLNKGWRQTKERILSTFTNKWGYLNVKLWVNNKAYLTCIHKLLALTWIPNPDGKKEVNHKDLDKSNNSLDNLEWVTQRENTVHATKLYRKRDLPIGVRLLGGRYNVKLSIQGKTYHLGSYNTPEEAHEVYKNAVYNWDKHKTIPIQKRYQNYKKSKK